MLTVSIGSRTGRTKCTILVIAPLRWSLLFFEVIVGIGNRSTKLVNESHIKGYTAVTFSTNSFQALPLQRKRVEDIFLYWGSCEKKGAPDTRQP